VVLWAGSQTHLSVIEHASSGEIDGGRAGQVFRIRSEEREVIVTAATGADGLWRGTVDGLQWVGALDASNVDLQIEGSHFALQPYGARSPSTATGAGIAAAPMPGVVVAIPAAIGDRVAAGDTLAIVEAMKTENRVLAGCDGIVSAIHCRVGDSTRAGDVLVEVTAG